MPKCHIHNNIRKLRFESEEMTQQYLGDKIGVTRQTVAAIETGKYSPTLELAFKIATVFDSPIDKIFVYKPNDSNK